ncbi:MAG: alpha/beta fold hydrolase [Nocardioides sp.]
MSRWTGMRALIAALTVSMLAAFGVSVVAVPAGADGLPFPLTSPAGDPPGANDWNCSVSKLRPKPVILVHGTFGDRKSILERLSREIKDTGFCVFSLDYGNRGTRDIAASAKELKAFTKRVLRATGAQRVSMVGHSQGGMMPRYYIKFLGGKRVVDDLVGLAPSNHGTSGTGRSANPTSDLFFGSNCTACQQQSAGSPFLTRLNRGDETPGRVSYTQITTRLDEVVVPHTSGYLEPGPRTRNVTIQDKCRSDLAEHVLIPMSRTAIAITVNALTRRGPARAGFQPGCSPPPL